MSSNIFRKIFWINLLVFMPQCWSSQVQIIKPRATLLSSDFKEKSEAELSLFTASLGFMDNKHLIYKSATYDFLKKYLRLTKWHEVKETRITKKYFQGHGVKVCSAYLSDPIFKEHGISLYVADDVNTFSTELKMVRFHYSTRKMAVVKVVKCPISRFDKREESKLYFHEIRYSELLQRRRGYFVFGNIERKWEHDDPLEFLMFTTSNKTPLPDLEEADEEVKFRRSKEPVFEGFTINFRVRKRPPSPEVSVRLFGEEAEIVFLTKMYGFVDHALPLWKKRHFIQTMDRLKQGYEVNAAKMQKIRRSDEKIVCKNYIENNNELKRRKIYMKKDITHAKIGWVTKTVEFPTSGIILDGRIFEILQCPVTFDQRFFYIWPVHFVDSTKAAQVFTFTGLGQNTDKVTPYVLSPVNERNFEISTILPPTDPLKKEENIPGISNSAKAGPSSNIPIPNLMDSMILDPAKVGRSGRYQLQDLIDFTNSSPQWNDFGSDLPEDWEKFDQDETGGKVEGSS